MLSSSGLATCHHRSQLTVRCRGTTAFADSEEEEGEKLKDVGQGGVDPVHLLLLVGLVRRRCLGTICPSRRQARGVSARQRGCRVLSQRLFLFEGALVGFADVIEPCYCATVNR